MDRVFVIFLVFALTSSCSESSPDLLPVSVEPLPSPPAVAPVPKEKTSRLVAGDIAPPVRLLDQHSAEWTLDGMLAEGNVALVFFRSADW